VRDKRERHCQIFFFFTTFLVSFLRELKIGDEDFLLFFFFSIGACCGGDGV